MDKQLSMLEQLAAVEPRPGDRELLCGARSVLSRYRGAAGDGSDLFRLCVHALTYLDWVDGLVGSVQAKVCEHCGADISLIIIAWGSWPDVVWIWERTLKRNP